jgi:hypothetical protein
MQRLWIASIVTAAVTAVLGATRSPDDPLQQAISAPLIWYVGDYLKKGATNYTSRIGAFRMPGCQGTR